MKKKRFYNNKKRGEKWTEPVKGRKINFADKYIDAGSGSDKFDNRRPTVKKPVFTKDNFRKFFTGLIIAVMCVVLVQTGYTLMDINIQRNAMPEDLGQTEDSAELDSVQLEVVATEIEPLAMDGGVMLDTVINDLHKDGYTSAVFDLKREDGTLSYLSTMATAQTYGAISSPAGDIAGSVSNLLSNDILPIARVCCYKDNIAPVADYTIALFSGGKIYKDSSDTTYLNPNSDGAYSYIKGVIEEGINSGITVFILDYCDLPEEFSTSNNGGFEYISTKLYEDLGSNIRLLEAKHITLSGTSTSAVEKELTTMVQLNEDDTVYYISCEKDDVVKTVLNNLGNVNYVISKD